MTEPSSLTGPVGFTIVAELGASRQITMPVNLPPGATKQQIDAALDLSIGAINRQQAKAGVINLKAEIENMERNLRTMEDDFQRLEAKAGAADKRLPGNEQQAREAVVINIKRMRDDIAARKMTLAEFEALAK